ncbi:hypothetical protein ABZX51_000785 [Aspergillus tubingensis]|uniref:Uncharacterized protein n=1 Tax=Aspergillus tubingensis (strain CBS 134.48) TaxID=767770 RepID=A0A1L9N8C2_ASPTC|nr:hypothetical protein ASPTUDRAFT_41658 [Aspergillus tubingensis CBS 134.48]
MLFKLTQRWRLIIIVLDINLGGGEGEIGKIASGLGSGRANKPRWASNQRARRDKTVCSTTETIKKGKQLSSESNLGASAGGTRLGAAETDSARYVRIVSNRFFAFRTKEVANVRRHNSHHWE